MTLLEEMRRRVVVADGAVGTMLHAAGHSFDGALAVLNLTRPAVVAAIHESYLGAGATLIQTNTFGANRPRLASHGYGDAVREINERGVELARRSCASVDTTTYLAGSVSPAVELARPSTLSREARLAAVEEQIDALADAGVDALVLETFGVLDELVDAVRLALNVGVPVIAQATFSEHERMASGDTPDGVAEALESEGADVIGANCTVGPRRLLSIVRQLGAATTLPISAQPNAGRPTRDPEDGTVRFDVEPEYFAQHVPLLVGAGVTLIGGCCGTTPAIIEAVAVAADGLRPATRGSGRVLPRAPRVRRAPKRLGRSGGRRAGAGPVVAAELTVDGSALDAVVSRVRRVGIDAVVLRSPRGGDVIASIGTAAELQQQTGVHPAVCVATWGRSLVSLHADMLGAHALGVRTVICETAADEPIGDYPRRDGGADIDSIALIGLLDSLNAGIDLDAFSTPPTSFVVGARCNLGRADLDAEIARTQAKIDAGAQFVVTRPLYEVESLERLVRAVDGRAAVYAALAPVRDHDHAASLLHETPAVRLPASVVDTLTRSSSPRQRGLELCCELMGPMLGLASGLVVSADDHEDLRHLLARAVEAGELSPHHNGRP